jgi:phage/plasmid primase-like uncharacterized protein/KaiC/GvpD/RAD55 family RecA-like ATPase
MMATQRADDLAEQFRQFIMKACDTDPGNIVADGRWHRFRISDTRHKGSKPGRYLLHLDGRPNGIFMDWRDGIRHQWKADGSYESLDREEIARRRTARQLDQLRGFEDAAADAIEFWKICTPLSDGLHPYLAKKGIGAQFGTRQGSGKRFGLGDVPCVIVPLSDADGRPMSLQAIREDGERRFWPNSTHEGSHFMLGKDSGQSPIVFCEGFSTAASIHEATGFPVVMCVTSGNMIQVARWAGHKWHGREMIVAGDDDWHLVDNPKVQRNVGKEAAINMARTLPGRLVFPDMAGLVTDGGDDFNDMVREYGLEEVRAMFISAEAATAVPPPLPLIWFDDNQPLLTGNWIVKNVLPAEAFCTIIGHPGCGKSFLALDLALHIAAGEPWQGRKVRKGLVLYLAAEGQRGQQNRVEAWKRHYQAQGLAFAMIPVALNLRDREADLPKLFETIQAAIHHAGGNLAVLVVDTLNRTFGGGDENGTDMSDYVDNVSRIKSHFGCTTIVVHHIPKNSETVSERGHGSLRGAIETSLVVSQDMESGIRTILCKKQKDAEDGWKSQFKLSVVELGHDEDGDPVTSCVVIPADEEPRAQRGAGPTLSSTQRQAHNELLATLEACPVATPRDLPDEMRGRMVGGKLATRAAWQQRWVAIAGGGKTPESAAATFRRAVTDLQNKGLVGAWNEFVWAINS